MSFEYHPSHFPAPPFISLLRPSHLPNTSFLFHHSTPLISSRSLTLPLPLYSPTLLHVLRLLKQSRDLDGGKGARVLLTAHQIKDVCHL